MKNLRNRVSYSMVFDNASQMSYLSDGTLLGANSATYYSYDIHGNVDSLLQDYGNGNIVANKMNTPLGNRFKRIAYNYDLISGKVNLVAYQPGRQDQFYHHYEYDAENRLTTVTTSKDSIYWERDASYAYYRHGPLARTELGQNQVQGLDYAYTIQGWLKTVNGNGTGQYGEQDMGEDGFYKPNNYNTNGGENQNVARDAFHYMLNYFDGDYTPVNSPTYSLNVFAGMPSSLPSSSTGADLFNGNIKSMLVGIPALSNQTPYLYGYRYDQLNRLVAMDAFTVTETASSNYLFDLQRNLSFTATSDYRERISYDPNGNIRTYWRNGLAGTGTDTLMDKLTYRYEKNSAGYMISNRLRYVQDAVADGNYPNDLNSQTSLNATQVLADNNPSAAGDNYQYDAIGNLIKDTKENISNIAWTVYGKIKTISKTDGTTINYTYDASGNRISKTVTTGGNTTGTYYVRDASGNTMSVYTSGNTAVNSGHLTQSEIHLYGSSRLGVFNTNLDAEGNNSAANIIFTRGNKFFELSNHLGNVLVTISDKKIGVDQTNDGQYDYYKADVVTANDYYPFGMQMPGRKYSQVNSSYRYGFNGKEIDNDVKGDGNQQDYGMRIYDPRMGRFLSVDPISTEYPELTPYQFASNTPIQAIDFDGLEAAYPKSSEVPSTYPWELGYVLKHKFKQQPESKFKPITNEELRKMKDRNNAATFKVATTVATLIPVGRGVQVGGTLIKLAATYIGRKSIEAGIDVFAQLATNNFDVNKVDWIDVGTNYLPSIGGKWGEVLTVAYKNVLEASADYTTEEGKGLETVINNKKDITNAMLEAVVGTVVDKVYGAGNNQIKKQLDKAGFSDKAIEKKLIEITEKQRDAVKEVIKNELQKQSAVNK